MILYGHHPVAEALRSGKPLEKVFLQMGMRGDVEREIRHLCKTADVPLSVVPKEKLNHLTKANHQGVVAYAAAIEYKDIEDIVPHIYDSGETPLLLVLDGVTDVRNIGAIARSAEAMGVHAIIVPQKGSALITADAVKSSAGALNHIPVCRVKSLVTTVQWLSLSGIRLMSADMKGGKPLFESDFTGPVALILGDEGEGISQALLHRSDEIVFIPMVGNTESLNVSVSAGILLYEASRQRR